MPGGIDTGGGGGGGSGGSGGSGGNPFPGEILSGAPDAAAAWAATAASCRWWAAAAASAVACCIALWCRWNARMLSMLRAQWFIMAAQVRRSQRSRQHRSMGTRRVFEEAFRCGLRAISLKGICVLRRRKISLPPSLPRSLPPSSASCPRRRLRRPIPAAAVESGRGDGRIRERRLGARTPDNAAPAGDKEESAAAAAAAADAARC